MIGNELSSYMKAKIEQAVETAKKVAAEAHREAVQEVIPLIEDEYEELYRKSTAQWYAAYTPIKYRRHYSIYNLFDVEADPDEMRLGYEMSEDGMTTGRNGYSLWNRVFVRGYHGGPRPGFSVRSTPVHQLFEEEKKEIEQKYKGIISQKVKEKYYQKMGQ